MLKLRSFSLLATLFFLLMTVGSRAQEIKATVTVNYDQLPIDKREEITTMKDDLENYINNTSYTGEEWEGERIPVDITVYIMGRSGNVYQARLFIISKRVLDGPDAAQSVTWRLYDDEWQFPYSRNAVFTYQTMRFDPLATLLDFYMHLVIGMDLDTYSEVGGTRQYQLARDIWQLGSSASAPGYSMVSEPGDFTRYNLVTELAGLSYETFRKQIFAYHVDGMDRMASEPQAGLQAIENVLADMVRFKNSLGRRSVLMQAFFDAKHQELADLFTNYANKAEAFSKLKYLDAPHTNAYEKAEESR